jgi:hypothetical protein
VSGSNIIFMAAVIERTPFSIIVFRIKELQPQWLQRKMFKSGMIFDNPYKAKTRI